MKVNMKNLILQSIVFSREKKYTQVTLNYNDPISKIWFHNKRLYFGSQSVSDEAVIEDTLKELDFLKSQATAYKLDYEHYPNIKIETKNNISNTQIFAIRIIDAICSIVKIRCIGFTNISVE